MEWRRKIFQSSNQPMKAKERVSKLQAITLSLNPDQTSPRMIPTGTMNIPPIVGVPCFLRCAWGPSSRMICPALSRRKTGTAKVPSIATPPAPKVKGSNSPELIFGCRKRSTPTIKLIKLIANPSARVLPDENFAFLTLTPVSTIAAPHTHNNHHTRFR